MSGESATNINTDITYLFLFYTVCNTEINKTTLPDYTPADGWTGIVGHAGTVAEIRRFYEDETIITSDDGKQPLRYSEVLCFTGPSTTKEDMIRILEKISYELQDEGYISVFEVTDKWISH